MTSCMASCTADADGILNCAGQMTANLIHTVSATLMTPIGGNMNELGVNRNAQTNGDQQVHKSGCVYWLAPANVDSLGGAITAMSLINFSEILRRMRLDFSDVFGRGSDFDRVRAELAADDGLAHFTQPARITGSAASFRIGGTVDLDTGALDNEMIVTVSLLHRNLPWYAAFLAFSNPASAAGVLLGSQVLFKDQIKQFSSGKYTIGGTYEDPDVRFVGIWRDDIAAPAVPGADANAAPPAVARGERREPGGEPKSVVD